jgi:hypothetical protein
MITSLHEVTEATMVAAHASGVTYWKRNRPHAATVEAIESLGRTLGWHEADNVAFVAGFFGAKRRDYK